MKAEVVRKRMLIKYRDDRYSMGHMALFIIVYDGVVLLNSPRGL